MSVDDERRRRELTILKLISERSLGTQAELIRALGSEGCEVTQATVSRDIRRLGLLKQPLANGGFRYVSPGAGEASDGSGSRLNLGNFVVGFAEAEAFLALRTRPGRAMAVASTLDELNLASVVGTLAGDDLVLILVERADQRQAVQANLAQYF